MLPADLVISFCPPSLGSNVHNQHHLQEAGDVNVNVDVNMNVNVNVNVMVNVNVNMVHHLHCIALHGSIALPR